MTVVGSGLELDIVLIQSRDKDAEFTFLNADDSVYDLTDSTVECKFYKVPPASTDIACTFVILTGVVTVPFTATHMDTLGTYEYVIEETKVGGELVVLVRGNIVVEEYVPFSETIEAWLRSELPANMELTTDYKNQRLFYWRNILQSAFEIADEDLNTESAWPEMVNSLFAKLIVHDALELSLKGSYVQFLGGDYTSTETIGGGGVKSIETGPTKVEYYDTAASAKSATSSSGSSQSTYEILKESICGLANWLKVKLPMCEQVPYPVVPIYEQNPDWAGTALPDL